MSQNAPSGDCRSRGVNSSILELEKHWEIAQRYALKCLAVAVILEGFAELLSRVVGRRRVENAIARVEGTGWGLFWCARECLYVANGDRRPEEWTE